MCRFSVLIVVIREAGNTVALGVSLALRVGRGVAGRCTAHLSNSLVASWTEIIRNCSAGSRREWLQRSPRPAQPLEKSLPPRRVYFRSQKFNLRLAKGMIPHVAIARAAILEPPRRPVRGPGARLHTVREARTTTQEDAAAQTVLRPTR